MRINSKISWSIFLLSLVGLPDPFYAQERQVRKRIEVQTGVPGQPGALVTAVFVDEDGNTDTLQHHGLTWLKDAGNAGTQLRYLDFAGHRRFIGVQLLALTPELREHFGVPPEKGVMVSKVLDGTPAERAGIRVGDIIMAAGGAPIAASTELSRAVNATEPDSEVSLGVWRDEEEITLQVGVEQSSRMVVDLTKDLLQGHRAFMLSEDGPKALHLEQLGPDDPQLRQLTQIHVPRYEDLEETLEHLNEYFDSDEWRGRLKRIQTMDWEQVEHRMKTVERRLLELETALEEEENR